jgi:hypothetical protein
MAQLDMQVEMWPKEPGEAGEWAHSLCQSSAQCSLDPQLAWFTCFLNPPQTEKE